MFFFDRLCMLPHAAGHARFYQVNISALEHNTTILITKMNCVCLKTPIMISNSILFTLALTRFFKNRVELALCYGLVGSRVDCTFAVPIILASYFGNIATNWHK